MNKEVELTAKLDKGEYAWLRKFLSENYKKAPKQRRFMVRFFKNRVDVRDPLDFRYKWTNGVNQIVLKKGALGSQSREETTIDLGKENQLESFVKLFSMLGFKKIIAVYRETEKFDGEYLEVSLISAQHYYFAEVEAKDGRSKKKALEKINAFYKLVGIKALNRSQYQTFLRKLDREVNFIFPLEEFPKPLLDSSKWKKITNTTVFTKTY